MSKEAMKLALEALEVINSSDNDRDFLHSDECEAMWFAIDALREALADQPVAEDSSVAQTAEQPAQQEPVEVKQIAEALRQVGLTLVRTRGSFRVMDLGRIKAQTTSPPAQRTWVGLTHEEHMEIMTGTMTTSSRMAAVEAKLKEKNGL